MRSRLFSLLAATVLAVGAAGAIGLPAQASCAGTPLTSAHQFTGTVRSTEHDGRIAHVVTDAGTNVTVRGTPSDSGAGFTSVDRTYIVGARYEFHPINDTDPYQDNACTATHQLGTRTSAADSGAHGTAMALGVGGAVAIAVSIATLLVRRRRSGAV